MSFLDSLSQSWHELVDRHRNRPFLEASMAACALVSMADGAVTLRDRVRVDEVLETLEALRVFDPHEGVDAFNRFVAEIAASPREGRERALAAMLIETREHRESAQLLIRVAVAVSRVQGVIPTTEQIEIVRLCGELGVEPADSGLYAAPDGRDLFDGNNDGD
ncbi:MAG: tellurite resistance TerB family protein [Chromatiales bacterium]|nr:tellurite resistance TerB family protein [Chromatiales bacterium]